MNTLIFEKSFNRHTEYLNPTLIKYNLGFHYEVLENKENGLLQPFFFKLCDELKKDNLDFAITHDDTVNAGVLYRENLVFITFGMFDSLCKLAELICCSGVLGNEKSEKRYENLNFIGNPFTGFKKTKPVFDCETTSKLLLVIFDCLLVFVIGHEKGHIDNAHGNIGQSKITEDITNTITGNLSVISQHAKELVADLSGFNHAKYRLNYSISKNKHTSPEVSKLLNNIDSDTLVLFILTCFFKMMDNIYGVSPDMTTRSHPYASFRAHTLLAMKFNYKNLESGGFDSLNAILTMVDEVFEYSSARHDSEWLKKSTTKEMSEWYSMIYGEIPKWRVT
ncbi:hypothetical protein NQT74_04810 [Alteromonas stellipolaris]|uniref:hypothetical protein n=1 Tax=Alteromonas stellipolaris TaxID=233316 RepID=UPI0021190E08|nr:hypothetical protein [Alteromonas stellipolaris]MCQ8847890.1 hypothetical protein [Alteromonas stellipolaris]